MKYAVDVAPVLNAQGGEFTEFQNLLFNLMSGLLPEHLSEQERKLCVANGIKFSDDGKTIL